MDACLRKSLSHNPDDRLLMIQRTASRTGRALYPYEVLNLAQSIFPEGMPEAEVDEKPVIVKGRKKAVKKAAPAPPPRVKLSSEWIHIHPKFRENTFKFIVSKIVKAMADQRLARGLPPGEDAMEAENYSLDASDRTSIPTYCLTILTQVADRYSCRATCT